MKRFTIFAVLLLLVGVSTGFALEVKPAFTLSGNGAVEFGVDLATGAIGFTNSFDATFKVFLVADDSSDTHAGTGAIYGSITISNMDLYWDNGAQQYNGDKAEATPAAADPEPLHFPKVKPDVSAKLVIAPFEIGVYGAPGMKADVVPEIETNDGLDDFSNTALDAVVDKEDITAYSYSGNGTYVKYSDPAGLFSVAADVKTAFGYDGVVAATQGWSFGIEPTLNITPNIAIGAGAFYGFGYAVNPFIADLTVTVTIPDAGSIKAGTNMVFGHTAQAFIMQAFLTGQMNFNKEATSFLLIKAVYDNANATNHLDGYVDFEIPSGTLAGNLKVSVLGYFLDLLTTLEYAAKAVVGYKVWSEGDMYITPQLTVVYGVPGERAPVVSALTVEPSVEIGLAANPLTTLTVGYGKNDLMNNDVGAVFMTLKVTY